MLKQTTNKLFILGCERSGSTWIANLLDANDSVIAYMEPFADYANLFPSFPPRYSYLDCITEDQRSVIKKYFAKLYHLKYPFLYKPGRNFVLRNLDRMVFHRLSNDSTKSTFELLSLNNLEQSVKLRNEEIVCEVIKELRLNFKVKVLNQCFPDAEYIVAIRHPQLQVESILKWFAKGRLMELRRNLDYFIHQIRQSKRFCKYSNLLQRVDSINQIEAQLYLYWIINYDVLIEDLIDIGANYTIVRNEDLIENGMSELNNVKVFDNEKVMNYYKRSTKTKSGLASESPTNTFRNSENYLQKNKDQLQESEVLSDLMSIYESKSIKLYREYFG